LWRTLSTQLVATMVVTSRWPQDDPCDDLAINLMTNLVSMARRNHRGDLAITSQWTSWRTSSAWLNATIVVTLWRPCNEPRDKPCQHGSSWPSWWPRGDLRWTLFTTSWRTYVSTAHRNHRGDLMATSDKPYPRPRDKPMSARLIATIVVTSQWTSSVTSSTPSSASVWPYGSMTKRYINGSVSQHTCFKRCMSPLTCNIQGQCSADGNKNLFSIQSNLR
jgi:hypothetical protein